ncbi:hypothetical protein QF000_005395 [Paraburkholderia atlantica]|uniref:Uncharacterized protein n=1 Tax=Paraburkholderia atlantica TaxID=2654982 RepID=A0A7W8Q9G8_PARAM|nr:hypothetical protein [Paraburkholderia atlantica]MBB5426169.1 hypothetical protein [Paraburkholderia atlantica]
MRTLTEFLDATDRAGVEPCWLTAVWLQRHQDNERIRQRVREALADLDGGYKTAQMALDEIADAAGFGRLGS